jgi:hypothetical protein
MKIEEIDLNRFYQWGIDVNGLFSWQSGPKTRNQNKWDLLNLNVRYGTVPQNPIIVRGVLYPGISKLPAGIP